MSRTELTLDGDLPGKLTRLVFFFAFFRRFWLGLREVFPSAFIALRRGLNTPQQD